MDHSPDDKRHYGPQSCCCSKQRGPQTWLSVRRGQALDCRDCVTAGRGCAVECKMATATLAQGNRLANSRALLRPTSEDKKVVATCKAQLTKWCTVLLIWSRWWCITVKFLRRIFRSRAWGVTGKSLEKIVDRTDLRSARLRKDWSRSGSELREIKARGRCQSLQSSLSVLYHDRSESEPSYAREET